MRNKIQPRNLTARAAYDVPGNPPSTRPESGVGNCYPGLEYDHRNLDRRFFPGLVLEFISQEDATDPKATLGGALLIEVDTTDPELGNPKYRDRARALSQQLNGDAGQALTQRGTRWFLSSLSQGGKTLSLKAGGGAPLDGLIVWRLVRSLRPEEVTLTFEQRGGNSAEPITLEGWRRRFTDENTGVLHPAYQPGELTQSLCSPWMHDFRDCGCTYWASNHPDIVLPEAEPGDTLLPAGAPEDPLRGRTRVDWLRADRSWPLTSAAQETAGANRRYQMSHFEINQRWQDLAIVLEDRESSGLYVPRSRAADNARPYATPAELRDQLVTLAGLEHLVVLLYLYARYSLISRQEAEALVEKTGRWRNLPDDVEFARHQLLEVAVSEMQHLRWVNHILWGLSETSLLPDWKYTPSVTQPLLEIPGSGKVATQPARLGPLDPAALQLFVDIEEPSGYIDGRYARVTATLLRSTYPKKLHELASTIVRDGEQHFLYFRDVQRVLLAYGTQDLPYLRPLQPGNPDDSQVKEALGTYQRILDDLFTGYQMGYIRNMSGLAQAREQMFALDAQAEALASKGLGIPYLLLFTAPGSGA